MYFFIYLKKTAIVMFAVLLFNARLILSTAASDIYFNCLFMVPLATVVSGVQER